MQFEQESRARWSLAAAIVTMIVWGVNFSFVKHVLEQIGVWPFMFLRFVILPLLGLVLLVVVFRGRLAMTWPKREDLARFIACAFIGHALHIALVMYGMNLSTPFSSSLVITSGPLLTLIILAVLGAERLRLSQVLGTLVAFVGIVLFLADKFAGGSLRAGTGDLLLLAAAFCFSLYTVLVRPLVDRYGPLIVLSYTLFFSAPLIVMFTLPSFLAASMREVSLGVWIGVFWSVVISSFFGWLVWSWINMVRGVARSAPLMYLSPPIAGLVAWLTLGEEFTPLKLIGAAVTMIGVAWAQFGGGPPRKETGQPDAG
jgi:drug/metabolite transporter (DMT)-like permease